MAKRHEIVADKLQKYPVAKDVSTILDKLSFRAWLPSPVPGWGLFTRRNESNQSNEFAAIYGNREFLVAGWYSSIEVPQRDLENMTNYVFNEGWLSRDIRKRTTAPAMMVISGPVAVALAYAIDPTSPPGGLGALLMGGGVVGVGGVAIAARQLLNRYYGSKLSGEAETYNYGKTAEQILRAGYNFERIQDYLKLRGFGP